MINNIRSFINLRNKFEELTEIKYRNLFKKNSDDQTMDIMIKELSSVSGTVYDKEYTFINYCRKKRNLIQHKNYEEEYNIYTDDFIEAFKNIVEKAKPVSVYKKAIHHVKQHSTNSTISEVLCDMNKNNFTHIPITENGKLVGIISETSIVKYLAEHKEVILDQGEKLSDNPDLFDLKYSKDNVKFVAKEDDYDMVVSKFIEEYKKGQKLSCVLVTQNGKPNEGILGIVTTWDIIGRDA